MHATPLPGKKNRHPVDRLADVRAEIKKLQDEETDLKAQITTEMGSSDSLGGDQYIASQALQERKGNIDDAAMKADGLDPEKYRKPASTFIVLKVEPRVMEAA